MVKLQSLAFPHWTRCGLVILLFIGACAPPRDGGADALERFFRDLEARRFDAAANLVRDASGAPLPAADRQTYIRGWRKAYEGYDIQFTEVVIRRVGEVRPDVLRRADAVEGGVYGVRFLGRSNSPCVPVNSDVIPGTTRPIAMKLKDGNWYLHSAGIIGFVHTCPGG